ncbi:TRAP transporter substrate-binding protein, partial [Methylobacterium frigidaeris]|uniref:Sialic acid-binding periplasmic protein SiaP n=1 Tax=Methylobacterium frigidaeris TaxID=2038277 RepID=A0AA37HHF8_9HYPH
MDRRSLLKLTVQTAVCAPSVLRIPNVHGAELVLKYANNFPATHPLSIRASEAAERVHLETSGKVEIRVFPSSQLGGDMDMLSQLRSGALEFLSFSPLVLSTLVPEAAISGIGFAWSGYDQLWSALDGRLGEHVRGQIEKTGLVVFEKAWDNGFRHMTSNIAPIVTPNDLRGLKIRVPPSPLWTSIFRAFGASPTSISFAELYTALQTRIVDAEENPFAIIKAAKLYEVQRYLSKTNHMWDGYWLLANRRRWNALPVDVQEVIRRNFNQSALDQRKDIAGQNASLEAELTADGLKISDVEAMTFRNVLQKTGFYKEWRQKFGEEAWQILENYTGPIS